MSLSIDSCGAEDAFAASLLPSLPGTAYTDPAVFEAEQRAIWRRSWLCVARVDEVAAAGDFLRTECGGESVLLVRGRDGDLNAFRNLCRHRGARLCLDVSGNLGRAITCRYHAWSYALDGRLIAVPNMPDMPDLVRDDFGLHPVRCAEWLGYVWVTLDADAGPLSAHVEPQIVERLGTSETLQRYGIERLVKARSITYEVASNWKCVVENFMECYHCATIHPELTAALPQFATGYGTISGGVGAGATFAEGVAGFSLSGRATRRPLPGLLPEDDRIFHGILLIPNVFLILVPDHVAVYRLVARDVGHTTVTVDWLFDADATGSADFDPEEAVRILDITNRQDFDACRRCQLGMASDAYRGFLVPAEHVVLGFHRWLRDRMGDGGPPA